MRQDVLGREGGPAEEVWEQLVQVLLGDRLILYSTVACRHSCGGDLGYADFTGKRQGRGEGALRPGASDQSFLSPWVEQARWTSCLCFGGWIEERGF